jgi:hypothetical protein
LLCSASGSCKNKNSVLDHNVTSSQSFSSSSSGLFQFLRNIKGLYAASLGIEILFIASAEIGENTDLLFYLYSILLFIPLALLAGSFTVVAPEAYRKIKRNAAA